MYPVGGVEMVRFEKRRPTGWLLAVTLLVVGSGAVPSWADVSLSVSPCEPPPAVVSGDRHLLDVDGWNGVRVLTPSGALASLSG